MIITPTPKKIILDMPSILYLMGSAAIAGFTLGLVLGAKLTT